MTKSALSTPATFPAMIVAAWSTSNRVTTFLVENLPAELWTTAIPGSTRRTFRALASHMHNARCMWVKTLGQPHGIVPPPPVDRNKVQRRQLVAALNRSGDAVGKLLRFGCEHDGQIPPTSAYAWRNLPLDVGHVLAYLVAHEGHHRGQIVMAARQLGHPLSSEITGGIWQWTKRSKEAIAV
jgi:uncharacterized damage-inducible protein DinB